MQKLRQFEFLTLAIKISFLFNFLHGCPLKYGNVCIPQHIIDRLGARNKNHHGDLYIISDDADNFRWVVKRPNIF